MPLVIRRRLATITGAQHRVRRRIQLVSFLLKIFPIIFRFFQEPTQMVDRTQVEWEADQEAFTTAANTDLTKDPG